MALFTTELCLCQSPELNLYDSSASQTLLRIKMLHNEERYGSMSCADSGAKSRDKGKPRCSQSKQMPATAIPVSLAHQKPT